MAIREGDKNKDSCLFKIIQGEENQGSAVIFQSKKQILLLHSFISLSSLSFVMILLCSLILGMKRSPKKSHISAMCVYVLWSNDSLM